MGDSAYDAPVQDVELDLYGVEQATLDCNERVGASVRRRTQPRGARIAPKGLPGSREHRVTCERGRPVVPLEQLHRRAPEAFERSREGCRRIARAGHLRPDRAAPGPERAA